MELRGFTPADEPGIRALLDKHRWGRDYIDGQVAGLSALSRPTSGFTAVYVDDGALSGFISAQFYDWNSLSQIHGLAVDPKRGRRGIGSRLVGVVEDFARSRGARGVYLDTPVDNRVGRAFYVANGYTESYVMPRYYSDDLDGVTLAKFFT
jgi:ribosomal protein S18 acetylase RimI-like enzyme